ncbi:sigma-54-dependent Fis family transcriptional regulator [Sulfoacidibacillus thermotolerans]|uniref:Sigma-54 factor interaction domain-containing protein n=1 Tax=Sulfoacidibacillus thermotolerans TaxID=1765684 RepID=A0A2U3D9A8_SULT2|nr:sigma-54-dependent Fis family transcriptional regulator [Sulfoacidibacillus thermotolerans]PWI57854.1 hypothetical protein BM613_06635 [Sulfoacidibacillus thermotolerans]
MTLPNHQNVIKASWIRSKQYGIPSTQSVTEFLEPSDLKFLKEKDSHLLQEILPNLERLYPYAHSQQSMLIVSNAQGYILHSKGDPHFIEHAVKIKLMEGAGWGEHARGTNAIGTALQEQNTVYVLGNEHYCEPNRTLYCVASPVFDPQGQLVAILDVSGYHGDFHPSLPYLVDTMARQIEDLLLFRSEKSQLVIEVTYQNQTRYLLAFDQDGRFVGGNREGRTLPLTESTVRTTGKNDFLRKLFHDRSQSFSNNLDDYKFSILIDRRSRVVSFAQSHETKRETPLFCRDQTMEQALQLAKRAASSEINVLIYGESGTGKELIAKFIHEQSVRSKGPLITMNCGAVSPSLLHSELFGYEGKAFTGASAQGQIGKFEAANGGTLFLDEIADMPEDMQKAMLRVLQERMITRIGGHRQIAIDVRIIAASNRNLWEEVQKNHFRLDLYFRLLGAQIHLPPLRSRTDRLELAEKLLCQIAAELKIDLPVLSTETKQFILSHDWPGNIRELIAVLRQGAFLANRGVIEIEQLRHHMFLPQSVTSEQEQSLNLKNIENEVILDTLNKTGGNITEASRLLGIGRNTLYRRLKKMKTKSQTTW